METLLTVAELARVLGVTPKAVYCRLYERRQSIPSPVSLPGCSSLRWRQSDVEAWLAALSTRTTRRQPPRARASKPVKLTGILADWEPYLTKEQLEKLQAG